MDWLCGMHGREENLEQNFEYLNEMGHSVSLYEFRRIILKWNLTIELLKNKLPTVTVLDTFLPKLLKLFSQLFFF